MILKKQNSSLKSWAMLAITFCLTTFATAQTNGNWQVQQFAPNVIKLVYQYTEYEKSFNVTNAIIAKPQAGLQAAYSVSDTRLNLQNIKLDIDPFIDNSGYRGMQIHLKKNEMIFGGGERAVPMNRRGYSLGLYNAPNYAYGLGAENLNYSVPFFISNMGYGVFFDNGSKGTADIGKTDKSYFRTTFEAGEINAYIIAGKTYQEILSAYHKLTGTQPLPPRWALGNLMSRFGYTSQAQAVDIAKQMKDSKVPVDAIIFDLFWFGDSIKGSLGNLDWVNKEKWPDPIKMIGDFKKQNIKTTLITEPYILQYTKAYSDALPYMCQDLNGNAYMLKQFYFGVGGLLDVFKKDVGNWIWNYHYKTQINNGVAAWWTDLGEPESHPADLYHNLTDLGINRATPANWVHNIYGHYWNKMMFDNYAKDYPNQRLFHLNRSGFAGSQRYSIFPWSGDVGRTWSGLQAQLPVMLGMSMSGVPYVHADAGGFALGDGDAELFVRWLQFATYTPIFRPHGTALYEWDPGAPSFASEAALYDEPYKSAARAAIIDRYKLLPYTYTLAYRQTKFAEPIVKPLLFNYTADNLAVKTEDEFLFGDNILVAPVLKKYAEKRRVYLPQGNWYEPVTNKIYAGKDSAFFDVSEYKKVVLYKAGSFTPTYNCDGENTTEIDRSKLNVQYVLSAEKSAYEMYDDDGESKNALTQNQFELIKFSSSGSNGKSLVITMQNNNGKYKGKPVARAINLTIPALETQPKTVTINGAAATYIWNADANTLQVKTSLKNVVVKVEVKW